MYKSLVVLAIIGTASVPASAQITHNAPATANQAQPAKPQTVKKRVCEQVDEDPYSRLGSRKICKTVEVPVTSNTSSGQEQPAAAAGDSH